MRPNKPVGIVGWGSYVPMFRIKEEDLAAAWGREWSRFASGLMVYEKSVPGLDEDTLTISYEAAMNALARAGVDPIELGAVYVGTESKPYAVKPTSTILAEAIGASGATTGADFEFACKAGTEAIQAVMGLVGSGMIKYGLAVGADTSQGAPGDPLEYTASAGGAAFVIGPAPESAAVIVASYSYVTDTPDFWRRALVKYPAHGRAFTGRPAYFHHIVSAAKGLMEELGTTPEDYDYAVFHQPNGKFPRRVGKMLGFPMEKVEPGLVTPVVGNTYSGSSLLGLTAVLDIAKPGDKILLVSFGSGAGSDAFHIEVTEKIEEVRDRAPKFRDYLERKVYVGYPFYARSMRMYKMPADVGAY